MCVSACASAGMCVSVCTSLGVCFEVSFTLLCASMCVFVFVHVQVEVHTISEYQFRIQTQKVSPVLVAQALVGDPEHGNISSVQFIYIRLFSRVARPTAAISS